MSPEHVRRVGDRFDIGIEWRSGRPFAVLHDTRFGGRLLVPIENVVDVARAFELTVDRIVELERGRVA